MGLIHNYPPPGSIIDLFHRAGIDTSKFNLNQEKIPIPCPNPPHEDKHASAFINVRTNICYCSFCTPNGFWTLWDLSKMFAIPIKSLRRNPHPPRTRTFNNSAPPKEPFTSLDALRVSRLAFARARDDDKVNDDRESYEYLAKRGIAESWNNNVFGILSNDMDLPKGIEWWPRAGYRIIVPLYNTSGKLVNVQARCIFANKRKVLFPKNSVSAGTVFANDAGLELLQGKWRGARIVILGEGLTDFLALCMVTALPVISAPGVGAAKNSIGKWADDALVLIAFDCDKAAEPVVIPTGNNIYNNGGARVRRLHWPHYAKDVCEFVEKHGGEKLQIFLDGQITEATRES